MKTNLYWHRNDLRMHDNECLCTANSGADCLLAVYVIDPRQFRMLDLGFRKTGYIRSRFLVQTLTDLREAYQEKGNNLMVRLGNPEDVIPDIVEKYNVDKITYQREITAEEVGVEELLTENLKTSNCEIISVWGLTLYHIDDLPFKPEEIPLMSKAFRLPLSKKAAVRPCFDTPKQLTQNPEVEDWGEIDQCEALDFSSEEMLFNDKIAFEGGERAALQRLEYYTFQSELLTSYRWTRNRSLGKDYSSKFSSWMALGSLSPRKIYWHVKQYEKEIKKNASTWWLVFEVVWRDYFKFLSMRFGNKIFHESGYRERTVDWKKDAYLFDRWRKGETGIPFVDAHMRELWYTGFMSNRGRVNCASFLTRDYQIDWRWGAAWFEHKLLDYDVSSNWMNWNMQATESWYTNPVHQGFKYDKNGDYVRTWVKELEKVPPVIIQAPWLLSEDEQKQYGTSSYKAPVDIYKKWQRSINNIQRALPSNIKSIESKKSIPK